MRSGEDRFGRHPPDLAPRCACAGSALEAGGQRAFDRASQQRYRSEGSQQLSAVVQMVADAGREGRAHPRSRNQDHVDQASDHAITRNSSVDRRAAPVDGRSVCARRERQPDLADGGAGSQPRTRSSVRSCAQKRSARVRGLRSRARTPRAWTTSRLVRHGVSESGCSLSGRASGPRTSETGCSASTRPSRALTARTSIQCIRPRRRALHGCWLRVPTRLHPITRRSRRRCRSPKRCLGPSFAREKRATSRSKRRPSVANDDGPVTRRVVPGADG